MDVEVIAQERSLNANTVNFAIPTETGLDPDILPTGAGTITYTIPTQSGAYSDGPPSGTGTVLVTLSPITKGTRKSLGIRNIRAYSWLSVLCFLQAIILVLL